MEAIFWDSEGVLLIDYLVGQRSVNAIYYKRVLEKLHQAIKKKRQGKLHGRVLFHHDNAPTHSSRLVRAKLRDLRWELLSHPPYSPDLAPSDFFLFPNLKKHSSSIEEVKKATTTWVHSNDAQFYREGLEGWRHRLQKCYDIDGHYVEK
jgi:transposase